MLDLKLMPSDNKVATYYPRLNRKKEVREMKAITITSILILAVFLIGCGEPISEEAQNIAAILSPNGNKIAFARWFHYYVNKVSVFDPTGRRDSKYHAAFIYTIDRSTKELTKLVEVGKDWYHRNIHLSWEGDFIAYSLPGTIYIMNPDGSDKRTVVTSTSTERYGPSMPFTLSADAQWLFYLDSKYHEYYGRDQLYSAYLDGAGKSFIKDLSDLGHTIQGMMWDSSQNRILIIHWSYEDNGQVASQINPDGKDLRKSETGLEEYRRRRPFAELKTLTRDITYAEWDVPSPDEFE